MSDGASKDAGTTGFWRDRWLEGRTGWDLGGPHPSLGRLVERAVEAGLAPGALILEPGCGRAHNGAALAAAGYRVTALDAVPEAIEAARALYGDRDGRLRLATADLFALPPELAGPYDAVFDRAMLCALPPAKREAYVDAMARALAPGGLFLALPFLEVDLTGREGPPFPIARPALEELMAPRFTLAAAEERTLPPEDRVRRELVSVWRRRS